MKKLIALAACAALCLGTWAEEEYWDGTYTWYYEIIGTSAQITYVPNVSGAITILGTIKVGGTEYPVTSIGYWACRDHDGLTSVTIPDSVTNIAEEAFSSCDGLTSVTIGKSVASIGKKAFDFCTNLKSITMQGDAPSVGMYAFAQVQSRCVVYLPDWKSGYEIDENGKWNGFTAEYYGLFTIDENGILTGVNLCGETNVSIPNTVKRIGAGAFRDCSGLTSVTIPDSVTSIGEEAFRGCSGLKSVTIPDSVAIIGDDVFFGCSGLKIATIGNSVTSIGNYMFYNCNGLTSVTIPDSVTSIGDAAFSGCSALKSVTITDTVTSIGSSAFSNCSGLKSVAIPNSVTRIEVAVFGGCRGLTSITIPDSVTSIGSSAFSSCSGLTSITIPDSVISIDSSAFSNCESLKTIRFGKNLVYLGYEAFSFCHALDSVYFTGDAPYAEDNIFRSTPKSLVVYVVEGTKGWLSGSSDELPTRWPGYYPSGNEHARLIRLASDGGSGGSGGGSGGGTSGGGVASSLVLTVTNVVVHYVTQSVPSAAVIPPATAGIVNIISEVNAGAAVAISAEWAAQYPGFATKFGNDFAKALTMQTGKRDGAGNPMMVWQDYVAGTDPTDESDVFMASITFDKDTGMPVISWTPELSKEETAKRRYTTYGKVKLTDADWVDIQEGEKGDYNFFRVTVEMK